MPSVIDKLANAMIRKKVAKTRLIVPLPQDGKLPVGQLVEIPLKNSVCPDGSGTLTYLRRGRSNNLLVMFNGGGLAFDDVSCNYPLTFGNLLTGKPLLYSGSMSEVAVFGTFLLPKEFGVFGADPAKNPFSDWNLAFLQYGTGDLHLGQGTHTFTNKKGQQQTIAFNGYLAVCEALDRAREFFPHPDKLLIAGGSAGAFGCSILAGEVADRFPDCENITMLCDSAQLIYDGWKKTVSDLYHAPAYICDTVHSDDITGDFLEYLYRNYGSRIKILYSQSIKDGILAKFQNYMNTGVLKYDEGTALFLKKRLAQRIRHLQQECPGIHYYIHDYAPPKMKGTEHCVCASNSWYSPRSEGVTPSQWVLDAIGGKLTDVGLALLSSD